MVVVKGLLRRIVFSTASLFLVSLLLDGVRITGGVVSYLTAGFLLSLMMLLLKPILQLISFPINAITFGFFSFVVNSIILFLLTVFDPNIHVFAFTLPSLSFLGFVTPAIGLNTWFALLVASLAVSGVYSLLTWLTTE